jgi:hypothetical protein
VNMTRTNFHLYVRLALIMGLTWAFGLIAGYVDTSGMMLMHTWHLGLFQWNKCVCLKYADSDCTAVKLALWSIAVCACRITVKSESCILPTDRLFVLLVICMINSGCFPIWPSLADLYSVSVQCVLWGMNCRVIWVFQPVS